MQGAISHCYRRRPPGLGGVVVLRAAQDGGYAEFSNRSCCETPKMPRSMPLVAPLVASLLLALLAAAGAAKEGPATDGNQSAQRVAQLVEQLGDDDYFVRERAQAELAKLGFQAFEALSAARMHDDVEVAVRARYLLRLMQIRWSAEGDPAHVQRLLEEYGKLPDESRRLRIDALANYDDLPSVEALCRIVRFDDSEARSKWAAQRLIERSPTNVAEWSAWSEAVERALAASPRQAAAWLRTFVETHDDAGAAADAWGKHLEKEQATWRQWPGESSPEAIRFLFDRRLQALEQAGQTAPIAATLEARVAFETGQPKRLARLVGTLAHYKTWDVLDRLVEQFEARFRSDAVLLYLLSAARRQQGDNERAEQLLADARTLHPAGANPEAHKQVAERLRDLGMHEWAEQEFRAAIAAGGGNAISNAVLEAYWLLAYMLHDQQQHDEAAQVVGELIDRISQQNGRRPGSSRVFQARREYYLACAALERGDRAAQLEHLEKVLQHSSLDVDALIALYHYPNLDPSRRRKVKVRIAQAADQFRAEIRQAEANSLDFSRVIAVQHNQLAWLISNTEGDYHEALESSRRSLEIDPRNAGYLDTLARCYFALKDYDRAVKYQTWACQGEPHSGQMQRQLELFRRAQAKHRARSEADAS